MNMSSTDSLLCYCFTHGPCPLLYIYIYISFLLYNESKQYFSAFMIHPLFFSFLLLHEKTHTTIKIKLKVGHSGQEMVPANNSQ